MNINEQKVTENYILICKTNFNQLKRNPNNKSKNFTKIEIMKKLLLSTLASIILISCGNKDSGEKLTSTNLKPEKENSEVNANEQAKPTLIIIPSDQLLEKFGMLKEEIAQGKKIYSRDFKGYLMKDPNAKFIITAIQSQFIKVGFPLNDLEQTLKSIDDVQITDEIDNISKDSKTRLLTSAKPDIILELNYDLIQDNNSRNLNKTITYTLGAIDAFTNKVVSTIQQTGFGKDDPDNDAGSLMKKALEKDLPEYTKQINSYFGDIIQKGREITVRVAVENGIKLSMEDECLKGDTYSDWVIDYLKKNTLKGSYKMERNTQTEIFFRNVRIKTLNQDGTQFSAYDFAKEMKKAIDKACGIKTTNKTQGLGDSYLVIKGM